MRLQGEHMRLVTLLKKSTTYGDHNEPVETWAADTSLFPSGEFYVEWWDQGGREMLDGGQIIAQKDIRCKCYYISVLNEKDYRIRKDSKDYDIESIKEVGREEGQILMLKIEDNA
jgi:hypothetical protein